MKPKITKSHWRLSSILSLLFLFTIHTNEAFMIKGNNEVTSSSLEILLWQNSSVPEHFIVIGTYMEEINAISHVNKTQLYIKGSGYFFNNLKNSYYVFAYKSTHKQATLNKLHELRTHTYFKEAWYYKHKPEKVALNKHLTNSKVSKSPQPVLKELISSGKSPEAVDHKQLIDKTGINKLNENSNVNNPVLKTKRPPHNEVKDNLVADSRSHSITQNLNRKVPKMETNEITLPVKENEESAIDQLQTGKSGDVIIFNNLLFHRNAAILHRSSELDLIKLLSIMTDNARMRIKIHGHTNGDFRGEIITLGKRDKSYFQTSSKNNYLKGDAVLLSMERAKVIKKYLQEKGILPGRIEIKGWGGQKTIYPMNSSSASYNSRVEIEILEK